VTPVRGDWVVVTDGADCPTGLVSRLLGRWSDVCSADGDGDYLVTWDGGWVVEPGDVEYRNGLARLGQQCWWVTAVRLATPEEVATHQLTQAGGL
jgi:hypothetical protein